MFSPSRDISPVVKRALLLPGFKSSQYRPALPYLVKGRCYSQEESSRMPPMSQKMEKLNTDLPPPRTNGGGGAGKKIALAVGGLIGAAVVGGALLIVDPFGFVTEQKKLAPAPTHANRKDNIYSQLSSAAAASHTSTGAAGTSNAATTGTSTTAITATDVGTSSAGTSSSSTQDVASSSIASVADDSVRLIMSGERSFDDKVLIAKRQKEAEERKAKKLKAEEDKLIAVQKQQEAERKHQELLKLTRTEKNIELEKSLCKDLDMAMEMLQEAKVLNQRAAELCSLRSTTLRKALEAEDNSVAQEYWPRIKELREQGTEQITAAMASSSVVDSHLRSLHVLIAKAKDDDMTKSNSSLIRYEKQVKDLAKELHYSVKQRESVHPSEDVMKHFYDVFKGEHLMLNKELENLPDFKPGHTGDKFSEEELNELLKFAHQRVYQLMKQRLELQCMQEPRFKDALGVQDEALRLTNKKRLEQALDEQKAEQQKILADELETVTARHEQKMKEELTRQGLARSKHNQDMLEMQKKQMIDEFQRTMQDHIEMERTAMVESLADTFAKLERLHSHARERADVLNEVNKVQQLVSSAQLLRLAIKQSVAVGANEDGYEYIQIGEAVTNCKDSLSDDTFVQTILATISDQALNDGIYTLGSLTNRFGNVYNECKRNALYPNSSGVISSALSRMYGKLLLFTVKPQYDNVEDFYKHGIEGMDTKDLLVQAHYFMGKHNIAEAIKCMVQLEGLPRHMAKGWISEALRYLEVHQASDVLIQYAFSKGLTQIL